MKVLGRVLVLGRIAASHVSAFQAHPEMDPGIAHLDALVADVFGGFCKFDFVQM
jgi:hypothetical protein